MRVVRGFVGWILLLSVFSFCSVCGMKKFCERIKKNKRQRRKSDINQKFMRAASNEDLDGVREWIKKGADIDLVNDFDENLLYNALDQGRPRLVRFLVQNNINMNKRDVLHRAAIHFAIANNDLESVKMLVEHGADKEVKVYYDTPLHKSIRYGNIQITNYLLENGANVEAYWCSLTCPFEMAIATGDMCFVRLVAKKGGDISKVIVPTINKEYYKYNLNFKQIEGFLIQLKDNDAVLLNSVAFLVNGDENEDQTYTCCFSICDFMLGQECTAFAKQTALESLVTIYKRYPFYFNISMMRYFFKNVPFNHRFFTLNDSVIAFAAAKDIVDCNNNNIFMACLRFDSSDAVANIFCNKYTLYANHKLARWLLLPDEKERIKGKGGKSEYEEAASQLIHAIECAKK